MNQEAARSKKEPPAPSKGAWTCVPEGGIAKVTMVVLRFEGGKPIHRLSLEDADGVCLGRYDWETELRDQQESLRQAFSAREAHRAPTPSVFIPSEMSKILGGAPPGALPA